MTVDWGKFCSGPLVFWSKCGPGGRGPGGRNPGVRGPCGRGLGLEDLAYQGEVMESWGAMGGMGDSLCHDR